MPFGVELPEADSETESSASDEASAQPSVFNFGWRNIHTAARARFYSEVAAGRPAKKKRPYENSRWAAEATYTRASSSKTYLPNGVYYPQRITGVLSKEECNCALYQIGLAIKNFWFLCLYGLPINTTLLGNPTRRQEVVLRPI